MAKEIETDPYKRLLKRLPKGVAYADQKYGTPIYPTIHSGFHSIRVNGDVIAAGKLLTRVHIHTIGMDTTQSVSLTPDAALALGKTLIDAARITQKVHKVVRVHKSTMIELAVKRLSRGK